MIVMEFPAAPPTEKYRHSILSDLFPKATEFLFSPLTNYVLVLLNNREEVINFKPVDGELLKIQGLHGLIITAPDHEYDFVSRFFDPWEGISEDPVTGSAHCVLAPFWSSQLNKSDMTGKQLSQRGGIVYCEAKKEIVVLKGNAVIVMEGMVV
jgi:predicted PhzF superfamily epimerase YddE/YHI9